MRTYKYDWENPEVFKKNKEDGHVIAFSYDNEQDALDRIEPKTKLTLNGTWKFHWQRGLEDCPEDFYKEAFNEKVSWYYFCMSYALYSSIRRRLF